LGKPTRRVERKGKKGKYHQVANQGEGKPSTEPSRESPGNGVRPWGIRAPGDIVFSPWAMKGRRCRFLLQRGKNVTCRSTKIVNVVNTIGRDCSENILEQPHWGKRRVESYDGTQPWRYLHVTQRGGQVKGGRRPERGGVGDYDSPIFLTRISRKRERKTQRGKEAKENSWGSLPDQGPKKGGFFL